MNGVRNKTKSTEKRYRDKLKGDNKEIRLKKLNEQNEKIRKIKEDYNFYRNHLQKTKKAKNLQKKIQ